MKVKYFCPEKPGEKEESRDLSLGDKKEFGQYSEYQPNLLLFVVSYLLKIIQQLLQRQQLQLSQQWQNQYLR